MFGTLDLELSTDTAESATLTVNSHWHKPPRGMVLHLPWFMEIVSVTADGEKVIANNDIVELSPKISTVKLIWHRRPNASAMSYAKTVESYKAEYARRYEHLLGTGELSPTTDKWSVPEN
jgi:hypothetical protein